MRSTHLLAHLSLFFTSAHAFEPWFPQYRCDAIGACPPNEKRQLKDRDAPGSLVVKAIQAAFHVGPQISSDDTPAEDAQAERVSREVERLSRKYARFQSAAVVRNKSLQSKRQSLYRIITAAETTVSNSASIAQDGTDFSYFAQVKLGSNETPLWMLLDTGAGTTWVMGSSCQSSACQKHSSFGSSDSDTFKDLSESFSVAYGSGSVKGEKVSDTLSFAGMKLEFQFGVANETSDDFNYFPFDGILGLSMAGGESQNFVQALKSSKLLESNIFCVYLNRAADGPNTSEISFGACNPEKYTGDFTYTAVGSQEGDWAIPVDGIAYDGQNSGAAGKLAYIDTGTSFVFGPQSDVAEFHSKIPGSSSDDGKTFKVPCDSNKDVTFSFSGVSYVISAKDWRSSPEADGTCTSNIYGHEVVPGAWLLGDVFLKNVYAVFDEDEKRIGFANRADPPPTTTANGAATTPDVVNKPGITSIASTQASATPTLGMGGHETPVSQPTQSSPTSQSGAASYASFARVNVAAAVSFCVCAMFGIF